MSIVINTECEEFNKFKNEDDEIIFDALFLNNLKSLEDKKNSIEYKYFADFLRFFINNFTNYEVEINGEIITECPKKASDFLAGLYTEIDIKIISINKKSGLVINNTLIKKLSGPIEVAILKPNEKFFREMKVNFDVNAPIFMLFGDYHPVSDTLCSPCNPENCLNIWDDYFYKLLDRIVDPRYPIDINVEAFRFETRLNADRDERPISKMMKMFNRCLKQNDESIMNSIKLSLCPTEKLRYQYSDIRQTYQTNQTSSIMNDVQFEFFYNTINYFTEYYATYDSQNEIIQEFLVDKLNNIRNKDDIFLFLDKMIGYYSKKYKSFFINGIEDFPKSFLEKQYNKSPILKDFFDNTLKTYFDLFNDNSNQYKFNEIMVAYYSTLKDILMIIIPNKDAFDIEFVKRKLSKFTSDILLKINEIMFNNFNIFLDVYYLFRSFSKRSIKSKREESNPLLSFCYFGFCHVINLTIYLITSGFYDIVYLSFDPSEGSIGYKVCNDRESNDEKLVKELDHKCVEFNTHINIDELYKHYISLSEEITSDGRKKRSKKRSLRKLKKRSLRKSKRKSPKRFK